MHPIAISILAAIALTIFIILSIIGSGSLGTIQGLDTLIIWFLGILNMSTTVICTGIIVHHIRKK